MSIKWIGAILIICGCGGFGALLAHNHRREERALRRLVGALDLMECELQYRMSALPELCRQAAREAHDVIGTVLTVLAEEMERQVAPDAQSCMHAALSRVKDIPPITAGCLDELGASLGRFDLPGQLKGLDAVRASCRRELDKLGENREQRLRGYQTLSLCAGAALAILFL